MVQIMEYDEIVLETFLKNQGKLFDENVAETLEEAKEFLEDCMALVFRDIRAVRKYWEEEGVDIEELSDEELKEELDRIFVRNEAYNSLMITIMSFGFKNGIPLDADLVFDVRFLPNPFYIDELKKKTGNDKEVYDYVMSFAEAGLFLDKLTDMLAFLIPNYVKEGKYRLVIGIGCTGGKHRSVTLANALYKRMKDHGNYGLTLVHKDVDRLK